MNPISWLNVRTYLSAKTLLTFFMITLLAACSDNLSEMAGPDGDAAAKGKPTESSNSVTYSDVNVDGLVHQFTLTSPRGAKAPSHLLIQFEACDGSYISGSYVTSVTINGSDVTNQILYTTGQGTGCSASSEDFIKLEDLLTANMTVVVTVSQPAAYASMIVKAGKNCEKENEFVTDFLCGVCRENETAWSAGSGYPGGNWATYTAYTLDPVTIYAGQEYKAGTVTFSEVNNGTITISIVLNEGFELAEGGETVKIQPYSSAPTAKPSPGLFSIKGNLLTIENVPAANFYGIHLDVLRTVPCE